MRHHDVADLAFSESDDAIEMGRVIWPRIDHDQVLGSHEIGVGPRTRHHRRVRSEEPHHTGEDLLWLTNCQARAAARLARSNRGKGTVAHLAEVSWPDPKSGRRPGSDSTRGSPPAGKSCGE